jgi:hypothetical protein
MSTAAKPSAPMVSVYSGRTCIGFVLNRGVAGYEAFTADQRSLGLFKTQREAADAISAKVAAAAAGVA